LTPDISKSAKGPLDIIGVFDQVKGIELKSKPEPEVVFAAILAKNRFWKFLVF